MDAIYDTIGQGYSAYRCADPRLQQELLEALSGMQRLVNIGSGTGALLSRDNLDLGYQLVVASP